MSVLIDNRIKGIMISSQQNEFIERVIKAVLDEEGHKDECEVSISLVTNEEIKALNKEYRNVDSPTDVLSFPMNDEFILGDIVISMERMEEQAKEYGHTVERELAFLLVHGILHLLGYDHGNEEDESLMMSKQEKLLNKLAIIR